MSHAHARFVFSDGTVLWGEYNGSCDFMRPKMFTTFDEMWANWRQDYEVSQPVHPEPCIVYHDYANGCGYLGTACRQSMRFIGPTNDEEAFRVPYRESGKEFEQATNPIGKWPVFRVASDIIFEDWERKVNA